MAVSITWATKVIFVPKADTTLIQASPEVRKYNVNTFRLELKALEESEEGMPFIRTHEHTPEKILSGVTYARIVEIINGYTVEFEDGQYAVTLEGPNNNLADVKVANQVSLITNNSAGSTVPLLPGDIADAVWDELENEHDLSGSFGELQDKQLKKIKQSIAHNIVKG